MVARVFSTLYNESAEFLAAYIENFLAFTEDDSSLIVNISAPAEAARGGLASPHLRVHLIAAQEPRRAHGHTLLAGHIQSYRYARQAMPEFEWFTTTASNALFVRPDDNAAAYAAVARSRRGCHIALNAMPAHWWWPKLAECTKLLDYLTDECGFTHASDGQIEGLTAARGDWDVLDARMDRIAEIARDLPAAGLFPLEEVLPQTIFANLASGRYVHSCKVLWTNERDLRAVTMSHLLAAQRDLPAHVASMKWFERDLSSPPTVAVCTPLGRDLLGLAAREAHPSLGSALMVHDLGSALARVAEGVPWQHPAWQDHGSAVALDWRGQVHRHIVPVAGAAGAELAYLYLEATGTDVRIAVDIATAGEQAGRIRIACHPHGETGETHPADTGSLQAVLYLRTRCIPGQGLVLRVRATPEVPQGADGLGRIVWRRGPGLYAWVDARHSRQNAAGVEHDILIPGDQIPRDPDTAVYVGLPIALGRTYTAALALDLGRSAPG